jgi:hypothetical protein
MAKKSSFIEKLYILCNTNDIFHKKSISWNPDNTSFIISNIDYFQKNILPKYFKHNNYSSFVRQLNMYNFSRKTSDNTLNNFKECFTNKYFTKDNQSNLHKIIRKKNYKRKYEDDEVVTNKRKYEDDEVVTNKRKYEDDEVVTNKRKRLNILEEKYSYLEEENIALKDKINNLEEKLIILSKLFDTSHIDYLYKDPNMIDNICDTTWIPN